MKAHKITEKAIAKVTTAIGADLTEAQLDEIRSILSDLTIDIAKDTAKHCTKRVVEVCGPRSGLASDIADEIKRSKVALIANLQSMR